MSDVTTDNNDGTSTEGSTGADNASSGTGGDDSLWESRFKGLNAKYGEEKTQFTAIAKENETLRKQIDDLQNGKVSAEEAAQAQVDRIKQELEAERNQRRIDSLKTRFPETFEVFGDTAASFDEATLAASEARLGGAESPAGEPTPRKHNESRSGTPTRKPESEKTAADIEAELLSMKVPWGA